MKPILFLSMFVFLFSCGKPKHEQVVTNSPLPLEPIQATGLNLGTTSNSYGGKNIVVTCDNNDQVLNSIRSDSLQSFKNRVDNNEFVSFTIINLTVEAYEMSQLLDQAIRTLESNPNSQVCPGQIIGAYYIPQGQP